MNWLTILVMWVSVAVGWVVAAIACEELDVGRRYIEWLRRGLFLLVLGILGFLGVMFVSDFKVWFLVLGVVGGVLAAYHFYSERFFTTFSFFAESVFVGICFMWATMVLIAGSGTNGGAEIGLLFASMMFLYGICAGTILYVKFKEYGRKSVYKIVSFVY